MTKISETVKKYSRCIFAGLLAVLIIGASLCFLAHSFEVSEVSFSPSQIYELTGTDEEKAEFSGKIGEELSDLFEKSEN